MTGQDAHLRLGFHTADQMTRQIVSTGTPAIDTLLGGGLEIGLTHLFYGDSGLHDDLLRAAVNVQLPENRGGLLSPAIVIDSANMLKMEILTDSACDVNLEPEDVVKYIYISRAFNSSQTYDLIMNQLEDFFRTVRARLLIVSGLPNLYISEGLTGEGLQQISHMALKLSTFTMRRGIITLISAPCSDRNPQLPAGGKALASSTQVHVHVAESKSYFKYTLAKHPQYPVRRTSRVKQMDFGTTPPLSDFLDV